MALLERFVDDSASGGDGLDNVGTVKFTALVNATYDHTGNGEGERHLSLTSAFSTYTFVTGDRVFLKNAVGGVADKLYKIASKVDSDAILLEADSGLTADSTADVDSSPGPWTWTEHMSTAVSNHKVNVKKGAYSVGGLNQSNAGTVLLPIVVVGYKEDLGDLDSAGRTSNQQELDIADFPIVTVTGTQAPNTFSIWQNIQIIGSAVNSHLFGSTAIDFVYLINCSFVNSNSTGAGRAIRGDNFYVAVNCDFTCSGTAHVSVLDADLSAHFSNCRVNSTAADGVTINSGTVENCVIFKQGTKGSIGIEYSNVFTVADHISGNTIFNFTDGIVTDPAVPTSIPVFANNIITDCTNAIRNAHSGTADVFCIAPNNRFRDNTTADLSGFTGLNINPITTDTGGPETDYTDTSADDFTLVSGSPAKAAGVIPFTDCGGLQRAEGAGGGGASAAIVG
jgi:hypothetical protein